MGSILRRKVTFAAALAVTCAAPVSIDLSPQPELRVDVTTATAQEPAPKTNATQPAPLMLADFHVE